MGLDERRAVPVRLSVEFTLLLLNHNVFTDSMRGKPSKLSRSFLSTMRVSTFLKRCKFPGGLYGSKEAMGRLLAKALVAQINCSK